MSDQFHSCRNEWLDINSKPGLNPKGIKHGPWVTTKSHNLLVTSRTEKVKKMHRMIKIGSMYLQVTTLWEGSMHYGMMLKGKNFCCLIKHMVTINKQSPSINNKPLTQNCNTKLVVSSIHLTSLYKIWRNRFSLDSKQVKCGVKIAVPWIPAAEQ